VKRKVRIFEGPDGAGKTTLARRVAELTGSRYVHHGPYPEIEDGVELAATYLASASGPGDVVLDRCWISEQPYGAAARAGADRLGPLAHAIETTLMLAPDVDAVVYLCLPQWHRVAENFIVRRCADTEHGEYLRLMDQLWSVYDSYDTEDLTSLRCVRIDPFDGRDWAEEIAGDR